MTTTEQKTCEHVPCTCAVERNERYCSESCRDAGSGEVEIACECGHATCSASGVPRGRGHAAGISPFAAPLFGILRRPPS